MEFVLKLYIFKNGSFIKFKATKIVTESYITEYQYFVFKQVL
ncbi:hypothetical protein LEP1GSC013_4068 [Leptospira interrogans serovar Valbuzzi str. Duyster]|nr:hypothetical protein LEP1GSC080_4186 [Leptospira interrogans str. FPW2026]EMJ56569.1 hypothetical protein LEP1GSC013_4068 [Leptospira interrogans serovar Valbuzzi str. Duyster]ENO73193.1 hypothetical protein LEP1GSC012_2840 [Leptospira interrogans serovar Valbuzzi str. Valbuzzi]